MIAANNEGMWNRTGVSVDFEIPPTFLQSRWFLALCGVLALVLLWLIYRLRMAQVAGRIRSRLEERLGERERIARELHDTLLQSVQGLVLRFQSVANKMPAEGSSRAHLEAALKRADEIIAEGRNRVQDLRVADGSGDLPELLRERAVGTGFDPAIPIRIVVEGRPRPVHPLVAVELGRIAGEALFNVARHARANSVEITIRFAARQLGVEIRDDGVGIAEDVLEKGHKPGHFGLIGMRERAERIWRQLFGRQPPRHGVRRDDDAARPAGLCRSGSAQAAVLNAFPSKEGTESCLTKAHRLSAFSSSTITRCCAKVSRRSWRTAPT